MIRTKRPPRIKGRPLKAGQRSLAYLRKHGYTAESCEQYRIMGSLADIVKARDEAFQRCNTLRDWLSRVWVDPSLVHSIPLDSVIGQPAQSRGPAFRGGFRKDLFDCADIVAVNDEEALLAQTTSRQQIGPHLLKFRRDPGISQLILRWIRIPPCRFVIHGWECVEVPCKSGNGTKAEWQCTERWVTAADLEPQ